MDNESEFPEWATQRTAQLTAILAQLLNSPRVPFDDRLHAVLPTRPGIYAIYEKTAPAGEVLRAGRTKTAAGGLHQRIYQNHLHGNQSGNLRQQLVSKGVCAEISETKSWICANCVVQFTVVEKVEGTPRNSRKVPVRSGR